MSRKGKKPKGKAVSGPERRFKIIVEESENPMNVQEIQNLVKTMARMIAEEYIADNPEIFARAQSANMNHSEELSEGPIFCLAECAIIDGDEPGGIHECVA